MRTLILFLSFLFFISCGETTEKKEENRQEETVKNDNEERKETSTKTIMFYGTSLTAGLGLEQEEAYPAIIQKKIDSLDLQYEVINAGLSGETTAAGKNRLNWVLNQDVDIFVLELGANDGLRGVSLDEVRKNLQVIIDAVWKKNPNVEIILAGMQIPPNMGEEYASAFKNIFPELAEKNDLHFIPFLLEDVGGIPELNQQDRIHPTAEGQKILAENVWEILEPVIKE